MKRTDLTTPSKANARNDEASPLAQGASSETSLPAELAAVAAEDIAALRQRWRKLKGGEPPDFRSEKLRRAVAYVLQAAALGDLSARELAELRLAGRKNAGASRRRAPASGTKLLRAWGGVVHEVLVVEDGYRWKGETWSSLSKIAQAITGTKWNGPDFFGLRSKGAKHG